MVLSAPAAAASPEASEWLKIALAPLAFRQSGSITVLRSSSFTQIRELIVALRQRAAHVRVCSDAREVLALAEREAFVLVAPNSAAWDALNLARPVFHERAWTAFFWCDPGSFELLETVAADLYDWRSNSVDVPSQPPSWAIENLLACERAESNCEWRGEGLDECVARAWSGRAVRRLDARTEYEKLLAAIEAAKDEFIAFEHVDSERELWRARWAVAERKRKTGCALVDVGDGVVSWGWWRLHASPMAWSEAIERLRAAGDPEPGLTAGWCGLEPEAIAWAERERVFGGARVDARAWRAVNAEAPAPTLANDRTEIVVEREFFTHGSVHPVLMVVAADRLQIDDVAARVLTRIEERQSVYVAPEEHALLAFAAFNEGRFSRAESLLSQLLLGGESSHDTTPWPLADRGDVENRLALSRLALGRYSLLLDDPRGSSSVRLSAAARAFDPRDARWLDEAALASNAHEQISPGFLELAIALGDSRVGRWLEQIPPTQFHTDRFVLDAVAGSLVASDSSAVLALANRLTNSIEPSPYARALTHLAASRALHRYGFSQHALHHAVLARTLFLSLFGPSHHFVGRAYLAEGRALFARGEWSSARDTFALAIASLDASVGPEHPDTHEARFEHAWTRRFLREEDTSAALREHYAAIITRVPETHPRLRMLAERIDLPPDLAFVPNSMDARDP